MNSKRASKEGSEQRKMEGKGGGRDEMRDGWRSISRKFVCKCWPVEMESGVFLFWLRDRPQRPLQWSLEERDVEEYMTRRGKD